MTFEAGPKLTIDRAVCRQLTAAPRSVEDDRRAEAGRSGAAAQTAGTKTQYPAGAHVHKLSMGMKVDVNTQKEYLNSDIWQ